MEAAARGFYRVERLAAEASGKEHLEAILEQMKVATLQDLFSLKALRFLVDTLESVLPERAA